MIADGFHKVPPGKVATVVTYLEMTSRPDLSALQAPSDIQLRKVAADVAWYRDIFERVGLPWLWASRRAMDDAALAAILTDPKVDIYTLSKDGADEALLELDFRQQGECELAFFGLTQKMIGTGAGRFLMHNAIMEAWAKPITRFHVHTCTFDSPQALGFYRRSGFTPIHQEVEVDDDPRLQGTLPEDAAPRVPMFR